MRAAVTRASASMEVMDVAEPEPPAWRGLVAPEAVGLCGSDFHYFMGDIGTIDDPSGAVPADPGARGRRDDRRGRADCPPDLATGMRVAIWPVNACGQCYPCSIGRGNACVRSA